MPNNPLSKLLIVFGTFLTLFLGKIAWSSPPWLKQLHQYSKTKPKIFWGVLVGVICLLSISIYGYHWYQHLPQPKFITAQITEPAITPLDEKLVPNNLSIDFGVEENGFNTKSVAPLSQIGKEAKGITLTPAMPGKWTWESDSRLIFKPAEDWPAGQTYSIHFDKTVFTPGTKLNSLNYSFSTQPFQAIISELKFYQNPENAAQREAVATITFNYPVDTSSLENKTTLQLEALKKGKLDLNAEKFKFKITYDEHKRTAYLHSEVLPLPIVERYLELRIAKGVKPISGASNTLNPISETVLIPDASSYFKIQNATVTIVRNEQDRPEQVLTIESSIGVKEAELRKAVHVYLLPQDYPATSTEKEKKNYAWQNPGEVTPDLLKLSIPLDLQTIPADRDYATLHSYKLTAPASRFIYLKLDKGITGFGDFILNNGYVAVLPVPEFPKQISFLHKGALLALNSEKKLSVLVRGLPAVKFEIARILPDEVNQLVTQTSGNFDDPQFINYSFNQQNISEIFSDIQRFDTTDPGKEQYTALDFAKYLGSKTNTNGPLGLFLLKAQGYDPEKKTPLDVTNTHLILVTDLGMLVKDNSDHTHDIFVQSITKGTPVANAKISILGKNGLPILTRDSDAQGQANFPMLDDFTDDREPTVYLATLGKDVAFIPYNKPDRQLNYSRFDVGGEYIYQSDFPTLNAYLFSDRGIYRPGDTAHIGVIVKQTFAQPQPAGLPLQLIVSDPRGTTVQQQKLTLDETGYLAIDFPTSSSASTGQYTINLFLIKDNLPRNILGSTTIRVEEFLPDRMRISAHLSQESTSGWISPTGLKAKIDLRNLYGAPASDRKISAKILLAPERVHFKEYPNYIFMDPLFDPNKPPKVFSDTLQETRTDSQGQAEFNLNLDRFEKATYQLTFFAEGFEAEGGRSVTTQTTALVSPLPYFVGYKTDGDLNYIQQNAERSVNFIAIDSQLKQQVVNNLKIQQLSLRPVTTLVKNPDGTYQYKSVIQTSVLNTAPFAVDANGSNYKLPTQQIGDFAIVVLDQNNTELSRFKYNVVGTSQIPLAKNAELTVKLNKSEYHPDEDIELQITSPYSGAGLITIERDKVYAYQWFKTDMTNSLQKIHIPKDFQGNGYVNVAFVRDWNSPEIYISPLSYSVVPFTMNHDNHDIKIDLSIPKSARPGEPFSINYKSDKPGKIIVFAVDEGILQAGNYSTPDPLSFFFKKQALQVLTQETVDLILPQFIAARELSTVGGDGGEEAALRRILNPFKRKSELPVAYWSGIVDTDSVPRQLIYPIPDYFNGALRVMAVAVAANAVGASSNTAEVKGDFVINPNVPTFVAPGDEFEITASVANNIKNSGANAAIQVELSTTPALKILDSAKKTLVISEGQEKTVHFKLHTQSVLGSAAVTFLVTANGKSSKMSATLSVRPANPFMTSIMSGSTEAANQALKLDRVLYPEYRSVEAAVSTSPLILVAGLQRYLDGYPFGCTEQLVSEAFPLLAMSNQPWFAQDQKQITNKIQLTIQMLGQRQLSGGGFSYWPDVLENNNNAFASVYAMHFLTEAKSQGYDVPNNLFQDGLTYLKDLSSQSVSDLDQARVQAYAIYILTRNEMVTTNYLTHLQLYLEENSVPDWHKDIISAYMAATYQLLKSYPEADKLIDYYKLQSTPHSSTDFYNKDIADAEYLYLLARHFPDRLAKKGNELVMSLVNAMNSGEINTILSSYSSLALSAYGQSYQMPHSAALSLSEKLADGQQKELITVDNQYQKISIDYLAKQINVNNPSKQRYFYQLTQSGYDKNLPNQSLKQGLEINREYRDTEGNVLDHIPLGGEMEVHIQVRSLNERYLTNIAIVDLLPGGFEVVRDSLSLEKVNAQSMDYADVREDRVVFFGGVGPDVKKIAYRIKATNTGKYTIPPIFANSMYDVAISARSVAGSFVVGS